MKRLWLRILIGAGLCLLAGGFLYGVLFAGVPYQDPTPEMSTIYAGHSRVASITCFIGAGSLIVGCVAGMIRIATTRFQKPAETP